MTGSPASPTGRTSSRSCRTVEAIIEREAECDPADARWPDGAEPRARAPRLGRARAARRGMLGANVDAIRKARDRALFKAAMERSASACAAARRPPRRSRRRRPSPDGFPGRAPPRFTMGGSGGGIAYNKEEFDAAIRWALPAVADHGASSKSVLGWKSSSSGHPRPADNFSSSAPSRTRPDGRARATRSPSRRRDDADRQGSTSASRDAARAVMTEIGVETGGSNVQFAINPGRPRHRHRDEPARLALARRSRRRRPAIRSRASPPSSRSATARRADERHHGHERRVRADDRLRRRQSGRFAFEVPRADPRLTTR